MQNSSKQAPFFPAKEEQNNKRRSVRRMFISLTLPRGSLNSTHSPSQPRVHLNSVIWERERGRDKVFVTLFLFLASKIQNKGCGGAGGVGEPRSGSFFSPCVLNAARDKWKEWKEKSKQDRIEQDASFAAVNFNASLCNVSQFWPVASFLRFNIAEWLAEGESSLFYICISFTANIKKDQIYE